MDHSPASANLVEIANAEAGLRNPRDLAFNPLSPDELWIVNAADNSVVIVHDASTDARSAERRQDAGAEHFMDVPTAIAFGADATTFGSVGTFATCGESRNGHDPSAPDFMGPALWTSDLSIFARKNPRGLGSHIDMLHEAPLCMGLAHEANNVFWAFSGKTNAIIRFDLGRDHGVGNDDHSDGQVAEYVRGLVKHTPGVPSGLAFHASDSMLYIADTANSRIARLHTKSGVRGARLPAPEPLRAYYRWDGATLEDVVSADSGQLTAPSGLQIHEDILFVTDNANGRISAFSLAGERITYHETGLPSGALGGLAFGPNHRIYFVDMLQGRVLRLEPKLPGAATTSALH